MTGTAENSPECRALLREEGSARKSLLLSLSGRWLLAEARPTLKSVLGGLDPAELENVGAIDFEADGLAAWDTALLMFVRSCQKWAEENGLVCRNGDLPEGVQNLIRLSQAGHPQDAGACSVRAGWMTVLGEHALSLFNGVANYCAFTGELILVLLAFFRGRAKVRGKDFLFILQSTGVMAVPIVSLLSFLTGLIIAFIGVIQLQKFAADIYVADLVGLATTRELGAVMAGVIMAGRTGAAFAAQLGSMKVNEELDSLTTFGISPMQFLVLPRVLAMLLMMPLLCVFANVVSIFGGMIVAIGISDVSVTQYLNQIDYAVSTADFWIGIIKSVVFGLIIAMAGCYRGLNCGKDATAVGLAATSAVVTAITWIVIADAVFAVLFHIIGI